MVTKEGYRSEGSLYQRPVPDGGWGWLVVLTSFLLMVLVATNFYGFSILLVAWVEYFQCDLGLVGWVGSIYAASGNILSVMISFVLDKYGCRTTAIVGVVINSLGFFLSSFAPNIWMLYFTFGILGGIGNGILILTCYVVVQQYFDKKRSLACGISTMGNAVGILLCGPVIQALITHFGWRGAVLIMSAVTLHGLLFAATFRPLQHRHSGPTYISTTETVHSTSWLVSLVSKITQKFKSDYMCKDPAFLVGCLANMLVAMAFLPFYSHTPKRAVMYGMTRDQVAWLPTYMGVAALVARPVSGVLAHYMNKVIWVGVTVAAMGITTMLYSLAVSYIPIIVCCVLVGYMCDSFLAITPPMLVELVGPSRFAQAQGIYQMQYGLGFLISLPVAGYLVDVTGNYELPFLVTGAMEVVAGLLYCCIPLARHTWTDRDQEILDTKVISDI